jgi:outer membrane usher protein
MSCPRATPGPNPLRRILLILALAFLVQGLAPAVRAAEPTWEEQVLQVQLNGTTFEEMLMVLLDGSGEYWIDARDFERLRVLVPGQPPHEQDGHQYYRLNAITGAAVHLDAAHGLLNVQLPPESFAAQSLSASTTGPGLPIQSGTGLFANYDLYAQQTRGATVGSALAEVGVFSGYGVLTSTSVMRNAAGSSGHVRLDTTFTRDFPDRLQTLTLGDTFTDPGSWGSALRFAGVRFARNFGIRPDLVTTPLLTASGSAVVPSTVDVFVNNRKVSSQEVQPGAFTINDLPVVTGAGDINLVVRDALGREVVLSQAFYSSPVLLAAGLSQYSFAAGKLRDKYTLSSFDYGPFVASANLGRGLTDRVTVAGHAEYLQGDGRAVGIDVASQLGTYGVGTVTLAAGGDDAGTGMLGGVGFEHRGQQGSFAMGIQYATDGFRRAADVVDRDYQVRFRGAAQATWSFGRAGSTSIAFAQRTYRNAEADQTISLGHNMRLGRGALNLTLTHMLGAREQTMGYLIWSMAFGRMRSVETSAEAVRGTPQDYNEVRASVMQMAPIGEGQGWRLSAAKSGSYDAWLLQRFSAAEVELRAAQNYGVSGQSLQLRGGATWLGGVPRASRHVDSSFAVVDVAGIPDVPIYVENQLVARTDARGQALLPNLLAYDINRVSIEPQDLPLNTTIDSRKLEIRPAWRSGVIARFPVERTHPATFQLLQDGGKPVPTGAAVRLNGGTATVAMQGMTYVTTLDKPSAGIAEWQGGRCEFLVRPAESDDPLPDLGSVLCIATGPAAQ